MLEQRPCQTVFSFLNKELQTNDPPGKGDVNCQIVTGSRRLRHRQTALGILLELPTEPARRGLTRDVRLQSVQPPPR